MSYLNFFGIKWQNLSSSVKFPLNSFGRLDSTYALINDLLLRVDTPGE